MSVSAWQRIDRFGRNLAPGALTLVLLLVSMVPLQVHGMDPLAPILVLPAIYYWTIHRPDLLRPSALFFIGVLQDLLTGGILGVSSLIFMALHWILVNQRRLFLAGTFSVIWFGFVLTVFSALTVQWCIYSIFAGAFLPIQPAVFQGLLTLVLFPLLSWAFFQVHRTFLSD